MPLQALIKCELPVWPKVQAVPVGAAPRQIGERRLQLTHCTASIRTRPETPKMTADKTRAKQQRWEERERLGGRAT